MNNNLFIVKMIRKYGALIAIVGLFIFLTFKVENGVFITPRNLTDLAIEIVRFGPMAIGMTMIMLMGGIDLSVASIFALGGVVSAYFSRYLDMPIYLVIPITLILAGIIPGFLNGFFSEKFRVHPFIVTLCMIVIAKGIALMLAGGATIGITREDYIFLGQTSIPVNITIGILIATFIFYVIFVIYSAFLKAKHEEASIDIRHILVRIVIAIVTLGILSYSFIGYRGMPLMFLIFAVIVAFGYYTLTQTKTGRSMYAIGGNHAAARVSGINVIKPWLFAFITTSVFAALSGIIYSSRVTLAESNAGSAYELDVIAAVLVGGTSLRGGIGNLKGTLFGILLMGIVSNGMERLGLGLYPQLIIRGLIVLTVLIFDSLTTNVEE